jgi:hypothetical protein
VTPAFGALGQTTTQSFSVLGFSYRGVEVGGFGDLEPDPSSFNLNPAIGLRLVAPFQLVLAIPGFGEAPLGGGSLSTGTDSKGRLVSAGYSAVGGTVTLQLAQLGNEMYLSSTGFGFWQSNFQPGSQFPYAVAQFVYGVPTPPTDVPSGGSGTYDGAEFATHIGPLTVDFTARTVSGAIKVGTAAGTRVYNLSGVLFTADGAGFRGRLTTGDPALDGEIEGRFTGSSAREIMGRYHVPNQQGPAPFVFAAVRR